MDGTPLQWTMSSIKFPNSNVGYAVHTEDFVRTKYAASCMPYGLAIIRAGS